MAHKRKKIPEDVKLKLWVLSGGRCEHPNCNEYVWRDGMTLKEDHFGHMAHIIAASPGGPRGDSVLSPELDTDFDNLMLLCLKHSKLIDGKNKSEYSIEQLRSYKQAHEDRIRRQTDIQPEMTTTILRFVANIKDRPVNISLPVAHQAIFPRYPADDRGIFMNFTDRPGSGEAHYWESLAIDISNQATRELAAGNDRPRPSHLSVFALGPIPALVKLGATIGNTIAADLFQFHRDTKNWSWMEETNEAFEFILNEQSGKNAEHVAIVLSLSGKIHFEEVYRVLPENPMVYEITLDEPTPSFLNQKSQLEKFRKIYRDLLTQIRERHGSAVVIHLFAAIPAPIAVLCGREILPKSDPTIVVYDQEKNQGGFIKILTIN